MGEADHAHDVGRKLGNLVRNTDYSISLRMLPHFGDKESNLVIEAGFPRVLELADCPWRI